MPLLTATQATALRNELARLKSRVPSAIPEFNVKRAERIAEIETTLDTGVILEKTPEMTRWDAAIIKTQQRDRKVRWPRGNYAEP
jgi:hypothetical protein